MSKSLSRQGTVLTIHTVHIMYEYEVCVLCITSIQYIVALTLALKICKSTQKFCVQCTVQ